MAINVSVQYNGGFLPDLILLTLCYYHPSAKNPIKCHEEVLPWQPMFPLKHFDGMLKMFRCVHIFL